MSLAPTDAFKKAMPGLATELATQLMTPAVINAMKETHLVKSIGLANRVIKTAKNVAGDIHRILLDAMQVNYMSGNLSKSDMARALRGHLRKVAYTADFFRMSSGPLAEAAFRSWALVLTQRGRVVSETDEFLKLVDDNEFREFRTMLNQLYLYENPAAAARPGREGGKFYTDAEREAAALKFEEAKGLYQNVMDRRAEVLEGSPEVAKQWKKDLATAQGRLDRARDDAWKKGADTEHFFDGKWVASEKYNRAEAIRIAELQNAMYLEGKAGQEMRVALVDTLPVIPKGKKLTQKQKAALLKQENLAMNDVQRDIIKGQETDIAEQLLREIDENTLENAGLTIEEAVSVYAQQLEARQIYASTKMSDIEIVNPNFIDYIKNYEVDLRYRDFQGGVGGFVKSIPERWHGSFGREDMKGAMIGLETKASRIVSDFSSYTDYVFRKVYYGDRVLPGMRQAMSKQAPAQLRERVTQVDEAFGHMKNNTVPAQDASEVTKEAYARIKPIWDSLFDEKSNDFILKGIDPDFFMKELDSLINAEALGVSIPKSVRATGITDWAKGLPFGGKPNTVNAKTDEFIVDFENRRQKFESSESNPFLVMNRIAQAAANARFKIGMVRNFDAKFSYRANNLSVEQALKEGYVRPVTTFGDSKYLDFLPEAEKGGLYPPAALDQFASVVREMDYTSNKPLGQVLTSISQVVQFIKATQTILMPRHLIGNFQGDSMMAFMNNVFSPGDWGSAARMAYKDAEEIVGAEYFKRFQSRLGGDIDGRKLELALRSVGFEDRKLLAPLRPGDDMTMADGTVKKATRFEPYRQVTVGVGDSKKTVKISENQLRILYKDNGIIEESYFQEDLGTLKDDIYLASDNVATNSVFKKLSARLRQAQRGITKGPGDINASVSNVARVAHANKILNSRSWKSIDDAMEKIALELAVYHPTPKGLAATERKWGRVAFLTYYTWMRQAHIAVTRQLLENHRNISAVNSLLYTWNTAQGYQPQNRGVSYSDSSAVPSYLSSRVGGAVITDTSPIVGGLVSGIPEGSQQTGLEAFLGGAIPTGRVGMSQTMIPFYDVINFWGLRVDPNRPLDENILNLGGRDFTQMPGLVGQVTQNVGKNISLFGEPLYAALTGQDPSTGKPINTEGAAGFLDYLISFFGQAQLAKGLGLYTPFLQREENNESNFLTENDRLIQLRNGLLNSKLTLPNDPQNIKNTQRERNARLRKFEEEVQKMVNKERQK